MAASNAALACPYSCSAASTLRLLPGHVAQQLPRAVPLLRRGVQPGFRRLHIRFVSDLEIALRGEQGSKPEDRLGPFVRSGRR